MSFDLMYQHTFEIDTDTTGSTPNFVPIAGGITSAEPANNEELAQDRYLDGEGFSETDVIGAQLVIAFSGHRKYGDEAQDFIYSKTLTIGNARRVPFKWTQPDGSVFNGDCTIANISGPSGDAGAKGEISFEIHFNGNPTYTPPTP